MLFWQHLDIQITSIHINPCLYTLTDYHFLVTHVKSEMIKPPFKGPGLQPLVSRSSAQHLLSGVAWE